MTDRLRTIGEGLVKLKEAVNELEVKGERNISLVFYILSRCQETIKAVDEVAAEAGAPLEKEE